MKSAITEYIPQRPPMVMIGELIAAKIDSAVSSLEIRPDNIFVENGKFTEPGLVENIAQTAAAMVGYHCKKNNLPVPVGFIAAVKDLKINFTPPVHSIITTKMKVINTVMDISIIEGSVELSGELICSCEMKILVRK